ncbi:MAG: GLUG motif-containing protein [Candidatus Marinimicrobia bacterium]|nr:GLUG motif-containing protein [Candidatus Neomarinimicrobiota bacterium]
MKKHLLFLIVFFVGYVCNAQTATAPAAGSGSAEDPWQIASLENLYWIAADSGHWGYSYLQTANINAAVTETWFGGKGWLPIGNGVTEFSGSYDGNGYVIDSLYVNRPGEKNIGLFGLTEQAVLQNISVINARISGRINVGCLVGLAVNGSSVERCYSRGEVTVQDTCGGGMFGGLKQSEVNESYSGGTVTGSEDAWGIGGFSGATWMNGTWVGDCYSTCSVSGTVYVGGFVGINEGNVFHCYSNGAVSGSGEYVGGLIGYTNNASVEDVVTACFWDTQRSGLGSSSGGTGVSIEEMRTLSTFTDAGWNFTDIWGMDSLVNDGFPYLPWKEKAVVPTAIAPEAGDGSANFPYQIASLENLYWIAADSNRWACHYIQTADIDATPTADWFGGKGWNPIGNGRVAFTGVYNGQGHTIDQLFICDSLTDALGLFGICQTATLSNLNITNINMRGANALGGLTGVADALTKIRHCYSSGTLRGECEVGTLVGWSRNSKILDCHTSGAVYGNTGNIGGLIGFAEESAIFNCYSYSPVNPSYTHGYCVGGLIGVLWKSNLMHCYSTGDVFGGTYIGGQVGGLIGNSRESSVKYCYSTGNAIAVNCTGGLIGECESTLVQNCFSRGNVTGSSRIGGLAGLVYVGSSIENCYSTGSIQGVLSLAGGLIGERYDSPVTNSFWDTETSGYSTSDGGEGKSTAEMKTIATYADAGWNFTDVWQMDTDVNNGYPTLKDRSYSIPVVATEYVINITAASALASAEILSLGYPFPVQHGFCWSPDGTPTLEDEKVELGKVDSLGIFTAEIEGLLPNTRYYIRAYATNTLGTAYGDTITFNTLQTEIVAGIPGEYALLPNYPNPFNPATTLCYALPEAIKVKLVVYDIAGRAVRTLIDSEQAAGYCSIVWDSRNDAGRQLGSGIYIYRLQAGDFMDTKKMLLLK